MSTRVDRVFCTTFLVTDFVDRLRKALEENGDGDRVKVEELTLTRKDSAFCWTEESIQRFPDVEYLITIPHLIGELSCHPDCRLKWVQLETAGCDIVVDALKKTETIPNFIVTRREAGYPLMISEYVIGHIIARERHFTTSYESQKRSEFERKQVRAYRVLGELTIGIIGLGTIGSGVARACKALNMTVSAVVRDEKFKSGKASQECVDQIRPMSQLSAMLESCDYVVSILPSTPQTINILSGDVLKPCHKKKTVLINVGRGNVIDDASLINAIKSGWLGGAILDVFNEEPLPPSSELWTLPGVTITPHVSGVSLPYLATANFIENLNAYREGRPMKYVVDFDKGY